MNLLSSAQHLGGYATVLQHLLVGGREVGNDSLAVGRYFYTRDSGDKTSKVFRNGV